MTLILVSSLCTHHSDLQCFDVELPDLPVVQKVANDLNETIDPEYSSHDEKEYDPAVLLNPEQKQKPLSNMANFMYQFIHNKHCS